MEESKKTTTTKLPEKSSFDMNESRMENVFIGISGMIGAGKTTLATALAKELVRSEKSFTSQFSFLRRSRSLSHSHRAESPGTLRACH